MHAHSWKRLLSTTAAALALAALTAPARAGSAADSAQRAEQAASRAEAAATRSEAAADRTTKAMDRLTAVMDAYEKKQAPAHHHAGHAKHAAKKQM